MHGSDPVLGTSLPKRARAHIVPKSVRALLPTELCRLLPIFEFAPFCGNLRHQPHTNLLEKYMRIRVASWYRHWRECFPDPGGRRQCAGHLLPAVFRSAEGKAGSPCPPTRLHDLDQITRWTQCTGEAS